MERIPHEYLLAENYYESKSIGSKAKSNKICEHCIKIIKKGTPHYMCHFYPEFHAYPVHKECKILFIESLRTVEEMKEYNEREY